MNAVIIGRVILAVAVAVAAIGSVSVYYGQVLVNQPALPPPPAPTILNLTLSGIVVGAFNESRLINQTTSLACADNETITGGDRLVNGLLLDGACTQTPVGNATLPNVTAFADCSAVDAGYLTASTLWTDGRMVNGVCTPLLLNTTLTGGDFTGATTLTLTDVASASTCGGAFLCEISIDAKGRTLALANGPSIFLANATGGGATGLLNNLSLSIIGTPNEVVVTPFASGLVQFAATQPICADCAPSFNMLTLTGTPLAITSGGTGLAFTPSNGQMLIGSGGSFVLSAITGTPNRVSVTLGAGSVTLALFQSLAPTSTPTFSTITLSTPLSFASGGTGLASTPAAGQLLVGSGGVFVLASLTGTANQIVVTPGAGTITLSLPQSVGTGSSPTFNSITLATTPLPRSSGGTGTSATPTNGQILIGVGATGNPILATITGTANQVTVTNGAGSITLSTPQNIAAASSPTFGSLAISGASGLPRLAGGTELKVTPSNGQVLIGIGGASGYSLGSITGTANQIVVTAGSGTIGFSLQTLVSAGSCGGDFNFCNTALDDTGRVTSYRNDSSPIIATAVTLNTAGCFALNASVYWMKTKVATGSTGTWAVRMQIDQSSATSATNTAGCSIQLNGAIPAGFSPNLPVAYPVLVQVVTGWYELAEVRITAGSTNILITPVYLSGTLLQGSSLQGWALNQANFQIGIVTVLYTVQEA